MIDIHGAIDAFRLGTLDLECTKMTLSQRKSGGPKFEGKGHIRQTDGALVFNLDVERREGADLPVISQMMFAGVGTGLIHEDDMYDLTATSADGTHWSASRIAAPIPNWNIQDDCGAIAGTLHSLLGEPVYSPGASHYLRLHFFEEFKLPMHLWASAGHLEICGAKFAVQQRSGSGDTVIEATSDSEFPPAFDMRIQEALQYVTGKSAIWRARLLAKNGATTLELASPRPGGGRSRFNEPLALISAEFRVHSWSMFKRYLSYVVEKTPSDFGEKTWNPLAYHLHNAYEASSASMDTWAVGACVAVEAILSLVKGRTEEEQEQERSREEEWAKLKNSMLAHVEAQTHFSERARHRARQLIEMAGSMSPPQKLRELARKGIVDIKNVRAWSKLRNPNVHRNLAGLKEPGAAEYAQMYAQLQRVGMLLHQLTFHLIGYEGPFTEYGETRLETRHYPLPESTGEAEGQRSP
jgi:hypothetical protein